MGVGVSWLGVNVFVPVTKGRAMTKEDDCKEMAATLAAIEQEVDDLLYMLRMGTLDDTLQEVLERLERMVL